MLSSGPATRTRSKTNHQPSDSDAFEPSLSTVYNWLRGLSTPSPHCLPLANKPLRSTQPRATPQSAAEPKRKRSMDEEDVENRHARLRRSDRNKKPREMVRGDKQDNPTPNVPRNQRGPTLPQALGHGSPTKGLAPALTRRDETEGELSSVSGLEATADRSLQYTLSHTATTKSSGRLSPSKIKGIRREYLEHLNPSITFETVAEGKKRWPTQIQILWRDQISSLVHETRVVPPGLKVRANQARHPLKLY